MKKKALIWLMIASFIVSVGGASFAEPNYVVVPAQRPFLSAESRIKDFAKKAEDARMQSGLYGVGLGLLYISLGSSFARSSYSSSSSSIYYGLGAGMAILGVKSLLFPTELEKNYSKTRQMNASTVDERAAREAFAEKTLKNGASEAEQGRKLVSGVLVGVGLLSSGSFYGLLYAGLGAVSFVMKSEIEKAYDEYVIDKEDFIKNQPVIPQTTGVSTVEGGTMLGTMEAR